MPLELPENWDEMTNEEKDTFYYENARAPSGWSHMKYEERSDYFKYHCECADIMYEDIRDYLMSIPRFKQAYTILKSPYNHSLYCIKLHLQGLSKYPRNVGS